MGNSHTSNINNFESLNKVLTSAVFQAQKDLHMANLVYLKQFFHIEHSTGEDDEQIEIDENGEGDDKDIQCPLENVILTPKKIKIRNDDTIIEVPLCTLLNMNYMDVKDVNIKTDIEMKTLRSDDVLLCAKHKENTPKIHLDINLQNTDISENMHRLIHKFHL